MKRIKALSLVILVIVGIGVVGLLGKMLVQNSTLGVGPEDNEVSWWIQIDGRLSPPVIHPNGGVILTTEDNVLLVKDGEVKWNYGAETSDFPPVVAADGTVYFASSDNKVYALDSAGAVKWTYTVGALAGYLTTSADGTVYFASSDNKVYALDSAGAVKWTYTVGGILPLDVTEEAVYAISYLDGRFSLLAITPAGGLKWSLDFSGWVYSLSVDDMDTAYVSLVAASQGASLVAVDPNGTVKWTFSQSGGLVFERPVIGGGVLYDTLQAENGGLYALGEG